MFLGSSKFKAFLSLTLFLLGMSAFGCEGSKNDPIDAVDDDNDTGADTGGEDTSLDIDIDIDGDSDGDSDADTESDGDDCDEELKLVYVVDYDNTFYTFDPLIQSNDAFKKVGNGTLSCPSGGQSFSMSVGRDGYAYVLFADQGLANPTCKALNQVDIKTGECLGVTPFVCGAQGFNVFGMGYATDGPDTTEESLYVGNLGTLVGNGNLGEIDVQSGAVTVKGPLSTGGPELTGNALGELWGFFPKALQPFIAQIDKSTGAVVASTKYAPPGLVSSPNAWAFAFWGGAFYIFYKTTTDVSTKVYKVENNTTTVFLPNTGKMIVGAGVSTCAPIVID